MTSMVKQSRRDVDDVNVDAGADADDIRADSDFIAYDDRSIRDFRENEKEAKKTIVKHMVKLRHNLQYNKHLLSVYLKAKAIFDKMVDEHRSQIHHLDEIYKHLSKLIHEQMTKKNKPSKKLRRGDPDSTNVTHDKPMLKELVKDKKNIGKLLSNMRKGLDKLMEIDTIIGTTIDKINEIQFIEDNDDRKEGEKDEEDSASEEDDEDNEDDEDEDDEDDDDEDEDNDDEDDEDDDDDDDDDEAEDSASDDDDEDDEDEDEDDEDDNDDDDEEDSASEDSEEEDREPIVFY